MSYDVLVIGGGPAGLSASINVRARGRSALVVSNPLEENPLWRAEKVDNYLGPVSYTHLRAHETWACPACPARRCWPPCAGTRSRRGWSFWRARC